MSSCLEYRDQYYWMSNRDLDALVYYALQTAEQMADTPFKRKRLNEFKAWTNTMYPGVHLNVSSVFPSIEGKEFWFEVFIEVEFAIYERRIGNQKSQTWQPRMIASAHFVATWLLDEINRHRNRL